MDSSPATTGRFRDKLNSNGIALAALLTLPAALVVYFAFNSGGYFPGAPAFVAAGLCIVLLLRCLFGRPFEGINAFGALIITAFAAYTLLTLVSQSWSHSPELAIENFDQALVYLLVLVLFCSVGRSEARVDWVLRTLAAAIVGVCVCALISRTLPRVWPIDLTFAASRLSFPISYWNTLGLSPRSGSFSVAICRASAPNMR